MKKIMFALLHVAYWLMYSLLFLSFFLILVINGKDQTLEMQEIWRIWVKMVIGFAYVPGILGFYFGYWVGFPKFLSHRKYKGFFTASLMAIAITALISALVTCVIYQRNVLFTDGWQSAIPQLILFAFIATVNLTLGCIIRGFIQSTYDIQIKEQLTRDRMQLELHLMRIQVNPHFLFNTLNNIDALIAMAPDRASLYLHRLSHFMRQLVYDTDQTLHPLDREILLLENYLELQNIRYKDERIFQWHINTSTEDIQVPPLITLPLIENCFKHGLVNQHNPVEVTIESKGQEIHITMSNTKTENVNTSSGGLGAVLTQKRITALFGPQAGLTCSQQGDRYFQILHFTPTV
jgi:two-component system, LytTR family, sensor kinase